MVISQTQEQDLWAEFAETGSPELREKLVLEGVPLVYYILGRIGVTREIGIEYEDMVHQGMLGLIDAVDRFNPQLGTRFSTYASLRIRGKVLDYMRSSDWMSRSSRQRSRVVQRGVSKFWMEHHRDPSDDELAVFLNMEVDEVQKGMADAGRVMLSLDVDMPSGPDEEVSLYDTHKDESQADPAELVFENDQKARMAGAIRQLSEREQLVLSLYYYEELTFKEIGKVLDVSESRVCQLHTRAILNIKGLLANE
jgi:RNA polymerase sigma factor FliA